MLTAQQCLGNFLKSSRFSLNKMVLPTSVQDVKRSEHTMYVSHATDTWSSVSHHISYYEYQPFTHIFKET